MSNLTNIEESNELEKENVNIENNGHRKFFDQDHTEQKKDGIDNFNNKQKKETNHFHVEANQMDTFDIDEEDKNRTKNKKKIKQIDAKSDGSLNKKDEGDDWIPTKKQKNNILMYDLTIIMIKDWIILILNL